MPLDKFNMHWNFLIATFNLVRQDVQKKRRRERLPPNLIVICEQWDVFILFTPQFEPFSKAYVKCEHLEVAYTMNTLRGLDVTCDGEKRGSSPLILLDDDDDDDDN